MLRKSPWPILILSALLALVTVGIGISYLGRTRTVGPELPTQAALALTTNTSALQGLEATVYKSPTCGCCSGYVEFLEKHGVTVNAVDTNDLVQVKTEHGIPDAAQSCHTTVMEGYVVEGHVPLTALEQFLSERPEVDGIALPGMPIGTPGMPGMKQGPFEVLALNGGELEPYGSF